MRKRLSDQGLLMRKLSGFFYFLEGKVVYKYELLHHDIEKIQKNKTEITAIKKIN